MSALGRRRSKNTAQHRRTHRRPAPPGARSRCLGGCYPTLRVGPPRLNLLSTQHLILTRRERKKTPPPLSGDRRIFLVAGARLQESSIYTQSRSRWSRKVRYHPKGSLRPPELQIPDWPLRPEVDGHQELAKSSSCDPLRTERKFPAMVLASIGTSSGQDHKFLR